MERPLSESSFIRPAIEREKGEIERVSFDVFNEPDTERFYSSFLEKARATPLTDLTEDIWSGLENTDSWNITPQDWPLVEEHAVEGHPERPRDWQFYKNRYEQGEPIEAPMIIKKGNLYHLVSGNTRLMVARALEITPMVLIVEMES